MNKGLHISLRAGERIYVNGAVLRVDRKVSLEFLNDVTFLLESHVIQPEETTTPLKQLYFFVQMMVIEPANAAMAKELFFKAAQEVSRTYASADILDGVAAARQLVQHNRLFEALKKIRFLFTAEVAIRALSKAEIVEKNMIEVA